VQRVYHTTADCVTRADVLLQRAQLTQGCSGLGVSLESGENILQ